MTDETTVPEVEEEDPAPERQVIPIEDLDKIEKLLDVFMNTIDTPHLSAIKQSCMDELVAINNTLAEAQEEAQVEYQKALAEWEAKRDAKRKAEEKERLAAEKKKADEAKAKAEKEGVETRDSWVPPRDTLAQPIERRV
jgi:regulator of protease activity HflC (stomatin/prohibitin superfamily)